MNGAERRFSYRDLKLNFKILLIYFIVLAVFIMFSFWLYNDYTLNITKDKVREYSEQVLTVQESSIENTIKRGSLKKVELDTGKDEIGILKDNYNEMIEEIDCLIKRGIQTEKDKRTYELNVLYEQIKPHFLYNTLDTIGYLVLSGDKERAYTAIENLGSYYHGSLSHGSTVVTVEEEIKIVTDYLELQKLRYGDIFDYRAEIEPELGKKKVLKLILQPIVENSPYHGIRPGGIKGSPMCDHTAG